MKLSRRGPFTSPGAMRGLPGLSGLAALCAIGCGGASPPSMSADAGANPRAPFCDGKTSVIYDPVSRSLDAWPDDFWTVDDPTTPTGLRVHVVGGDNFDASAVPSTFSKVFSDVSLLDGFGTTAPLLLRLTGPLDPKTLPTQGGPAQPSDSIVLVNLDSDPPALPALIDCDITVVDEYIGGTAPGDQAATLVLRPMVPLSPKSHYALAVTTRLHDADGACIAPSAAQYQLLSGKATDAQLLRMQPRYTDLVTRLQAAQVITAASDLSAALLFTTQHTVDDSAGIAADIRKHPVAYKSLGPCVLDPGGAYRTCEGMMSSFDYRMNHLYVDEADLTGHDAWQVPVVIYLPVTPKDGGYPTIIFGHGLGGDRHQAADLAVLSAPQGFATVAIDAVKHGDHPDQPPEPGRINAILDFFGFSLKGQPLDSQKLRDNFRQSTYDKLQLVELLRPGVDADGDGKDDVGIAQLMYLGVSLGGIMSAELLAFVPEVKVAMPIVPGARVTEIIQFADMFAPIITLFSNGASDGEIARFFPILQTAIDRGDAGAYTQHIVRNRLPGFDAAYPQTLMQMVIADNTVPNICNLFFARGLGVPHVGDELLPIGTIPHIQDLPLSANLDGSHTGGVFQYDVVWNGNGPTTQMATHSNVAANPVTITQTLHFVETYLANGVSEIIDPYRTLGIKK